ncbi:MAG: HAD hydrolase-like protein [Oscillospiraceae bacterium]
MKYKAILFDLDGTLTDPQEGILNSIQYATVFYGVKTDRAQLIEYIGPPLKDTFDKLIGKELSMGAVKKYRERFVDGGGLYENKIYPNVKEALCKLKDMGYILCTASSKPQPFVEKILQFFDIDKFFDFAGGASLDETRSQKEEVIKYVLETAGLNNNEVLMVGDRKFDLIGAEQMGIDAVGVLYGFGDYAELSQYPNIALIDDISQLIEILA